MARLDTSVGIGIAHRNDAVAHRIRVPCGPRALLHAAAIFYRGERRAGSHRDPHDRQDTDFSDPTWKCQAADCSYDYTSRRNPVRPSCSSGS